MTDKALAWEIESLTQPSCYSTPAMPKVDGSDGLAVGLKQTMARPDGVMVLGAPESALGEFDSNYPIAFARRKRVGLRPSCSEHRNAPRVQRLPDR